MSNKVKKPDTKKDVNEYSYIEKLKDEISESSDESSTDTDDDNDDDEDDDEEEIKETKKITIKSKTRITYVYDDDSDDHDDDDGEIHKKNMAQVSGKAESKSDLQTIIPIQTESKAVFTQTEMNKKRKNNFCRNCLLFWLIVFLILLILLLLLYLLLMLWNRHKTLPADCSYLIYLENNASYYKVPKRNRSEFVNDTLNALIGTQSLISAYGPLNNIRNETCHNIVKRPLGNPHIGLLWYNENDLDLHLTTPDNSEIYYKKRNSSSGGSLDWDMNSGSILSKTPCENIYWRNGQALSGSYNVYVNFFNKQSKDQITKFKLIIWINDEKEEIEDTLSNEGQKILVYTFNIENP